MITIKLVDTNITPHNYNLCEWVGVCVKNFKIYSLSNFKTRNTVLLTTVTRLFI